MTDQNQTETVHTVEERTIVTNRLNMGWLLAALLAGILLTLLAVFVWDRIPDACCKWQAPAATVTPAFVPAPVQVAPRVIMPSPYEVPAPAPQQESILPPSAQPTVAGGGSCARRLMVASDATFRNQQAAAARQLAQKERCEADRACTYMSRTVPGRDSRGQPRLQFQSRCVSARAAGI